MMETITIPLEDFLGLELECSYYYEPAVPEDTVNPPEQAVVELDSVLINGQRLSLTDKQWFLLEQRIYELREEEQNERTN